jgi:hypothetical protein
MKAKALLIHPSHQGVCGRHGTEDLCVTPGELAGFPCGDGISDPISESEMESNALQVVGQPNSTAEAVKAAWVALSENGKSAGKGGWSEQTGK